MPMAGSTPNVHCVNSGATAGTGNTTANTNNTVGSTSKSWELSDYELHRIPQDACTDGSEIAVSPRALHSELMCPICLDMLQQTMTTKECLHRFCQECIVTALRSGNKECPTCRKKLVSKRSLRPDPNFDMLISKIYPSRDEYETQQQLAMAKLSKSHNQLALASTIEEGLRAQQLRKPLRPSKGTANHSNSLTDGALDKASAESNVGSTLGALPRQASVGNISSSWKDTINAVASGLDPSAMNSNSTNNSASNNLHILNTPTTDPLVGSGQLHAPSLTETTGNDVSSIASEGIAEIELVFKPHPDMQSGVPISVPQDLIQTRYIKTSANASVDHLRKYLGMRLALDSENQDMEDEPLKNCTIWICPNGTFLKIPSGLTLGQVYDKHWQINKPLEVFYFWKKG